MLCVQRQEVLAQHLSLPVDWVFQGQVLTGAASASIIECLPTLADKKQRSGLQGDRPIFAGAIGASTADKVPDLLAPQYYFVEHYNCIQLSRTL